MAKKVHIPKFDNSEGTVKIETWYVKEGDQINKGDVLFDVETEKAILEVESQFEGFILKIVIHKGEEAKINSIAAIIGDKDEEIPNN